MAVEEERLEAAAKNSAGEKGEQKDEPDSSEYVAWEIISLMSNNF